MKKTVPKIDVAKAIELRMKGLSYRDIGLYFNCSHSSVAERLKPYIQGDEIDLEAYKTHRADLMTLKQAQVMGALTIEDIEKASAKDKALVYGIFYDKERLERGQSTSNVAVILASHVVEAGKQWGKKIQDEPIEAEIVTGGEPVKKAGAIESEIKTEAENETGK